MFQDLKCIYTYIHCTYRMENQRAYDMMRRNQGQQQGDTQLLRRMFQNLKGIYRHLLYVLDEKCTWV